MSRMLIIAEKPSVSRAIESVVSNNPKLFKDDFEFDAFHGHLMELVQPDEIDQEWKKWNERTLPMLPKRIPYKKADAASVNRLVKRIKNGNYDFVVNACDAAIEGELIFWSFYKSMKLKTPVKRYWASSNAEDGIKKALKNLRDQKFSEPLVQAAFLRARMDWLFGLNGSRALTLALGQTMALGRVMTTVENIVVMRENEILNFKEMPFWEIETTLSKDGQEFPAMVYVKEDRRFSNEAEAKKVLSSIPKTAEVTSCDSKEKKTKAPLLFSLAGLQKAANKTYGFTPDKTLVIAQSLYEAGYITYPRTDSSYLSSDIVPEVFDHVKACYKVPGYKVYAKTITEAAVTSVLSTKVYVDDSKVEDHHAIIPDSAVKWKTLSEEEKKVYCLIVRQFLSIFLPEKVVMETEAVFDAAGITLKAKGQVVKDPGFMVLYKKAVSEDTELPPLNVGDRVKISEVNLNEGKTTPPERYTPATLIAAMQNAGRFIDDKNAKAVLKEGGGIGTAATRAEILKKLVDKKYFDLKKNHYFPSELCMKTIAQIGDLQFCNPKFTADWQDKLNRLAKGEKLDLKGEIDDMVADTVDAIFDTVTPIPKEDNSLGKCPKCGKPVYKGKSGYYCGGYKEGCDFSIYELLCDKKVTEEDMKVLLSGGTAKEREFAKKEGGKFKASFVLEDGKLKFVFPEKKSLGKCPVCGADIFENSYYYYCADRDCGFKISKTVMEAKISPSDMTKLLNGKSISKQCKFRNGKFGEVGMSIEDGELAFDFFN